MPGRENIDQQIQTLTETYIFLAAEGDVTRPQLKTKMLEALGVVEDGSEISSLSFEGGNTAAVAMYPKEVVLAAARAAIQHIDAQAAGGLPQSGGVFTDLSYMRIET